MIELPNLPNNVYYAIKDTIMKQTQSQISYSSQNLIPNKLKTCERQRQFVINYIEPNKTLIINEFSKNITDLHIHVASGKCKLISKNPSTSCSRSKHLTSPQSYLIKQGIVKSTELKIFTYQFPTIIAIDILKPDRNIIDGTDQVPEQYLYSPNKEDLKWRHSFIRQKLSIDDIRTRTLFLDAEFARSTENKLIPISVAILNYDGIKIINSLAYPRQKIRNYETKFHGFTERDLIGQIDSEDLKHQVQKLVRGMILIGSDLQADIRALDIDTSQLLGIRDLSNAIIIRQKTQSDKQFMKLQEITQQILNKDIQTGYHGALEDATSILEIYKTVEAEWEDHSGCYTKNPMEQINDIQDEIKIYPVIDEFVYDDQPDDEYMSCEDNIQPEPVSTKQPEKILPYENQRHEQTNLNDQTSPDATTITLRGNITFTISPENHITIQIVPDSL